MMTHEPTPKRPSRCTIARPLMPPPPSIKDDASVRWPGRSSPKTIHQSPCRSELREVRAALLVRQPAPWPSGSEGKGHSTQTPCPTTAPKTKVGSATAAAASSGVRGNGLTRPRSVLRTDGGNFPALEAARRFQHVARIPKGVQQLPAHSALHSLSAFHLVLFSSQHLYPIEPSLQHLQRGVVYTWPPGNVPGGRFCFCPGLLRTHPGRTGMPQDAPL
jgi:hypothetical protein